MCENSSWFNIQKQLVLMYTQNYYYFREPVPLSPHNSLFYRRRTGSTFVIAV